MSKARGHDDRRALGGCGVYRPEQDCRVIRHSEMIRIHSVGNDAGLHHQFLFIFRNFLNPRKHLNLRKAPCHKIVRLSLDDFFSPRIDWGRCQEPGESQTHPLRRRKMRAGYFCRVNLQLPQSSPNARETRFGHEDASGSRGWSEVDGARNVRRHRDGSTAPS